MYRIKLALSVFAILLCELPGLAQTKTNAAPNEKKIGSYTWMTANLNVEKFRNGDLIPEAKTPEEWRKANESQSPAWCYLNNDPANGWKYGKLYNWYAVNDFRSLAPEGWHIPTIHEWLNLIEHLGKGEIAVEKMKSRTGWDEKIVDIYCRNCRDWADSYRFRVPCHACKNNQIIRREKRYGGNNSSGFSAYPSGKREKFNEYINKAEFHGEADAGNLARWWTASSGVEWGILGYFDYTIAIRNGCPPGGEEVNIVEMWHDNLYYNCAEKSEGLAVRCVKNQPSTIQFSKISCDPSNSESGIFEGIEIGNDTSVLEYSGCNGGFFNDVVVKSSNIPGISLSIFSDTLEKGNGSINMYFSGTPEKAGLAEFPLKIGGVSTVIYKKIRPGVMHDCAPVPIHNPEISYGRVKDKEGNSYKTIRAGDYEWMAENLRTTIFNDGTPLSEAQSEESWRNAGQQRIPAACRLTENGRQAGCEFGVFYNRYAVESTKGLCPAGWEIPNSDNWEEIMKEAGGKQELLTSNSRYWSNSGYYSSNSIGFSALPSGIREDNGAFSGGGRYVHFWQKYRKSSDNPDGERDSKIQIGPESYGTDDFHQTESDFMEAGNGKNVRCMRLKRPAVLGRLYCSPVDGAVLPGGLIENTEVVNQALQIPFSQNSGGNIAPVKIASEGVNGLWAELDSGFYSTSESGILPFRVNGKPDGFGTAVFRIQAGMKMCLCSLEIKAVAGKLNPILPEKEYRISLDVTEKKFSPDSIQLEYQAGNGGFLEKMMLKDLNNRGPDLMLRATRLNSGNGYLVFRPEGFTGYAGKSNYLLSIGSQEYNLHVIYPGPETGEIKTSEITPRVIAYDRILKSFEKNSIELPYPEGNGLKYNGLKIKSEGVRGITAELQSGILASGPGKLNLEISGTPSEEGSAAFSFEFAGRKVSVSLPVQINYDLPNGCGVRNIHCRGLKQSYGDLVDQAGNSYKTIIIKGREWMAENLRTSRFRNGDPIPLIQDQAEWTKSGKDGFCWYENDSAKYSCAYGAIYNKYAMKDSRKLCPAGWDIPKEDEWNELYEFIGGYQINSAIHIISGLEFWNQVKWSTHPYAREVNTVGFSALPGGMRNKIFSGAGTTAAWWSKKGFAQTSVPDFLFKIQEEYEKESGFSIRCIRQK